MFHRLILLATVTFASAFAGEILITDFISPTTETYTGLDALFTADTSNCGGILCASTPLVINGNTYNTSANDNHFLRYLSTSPNNLSCIGATGDCVNTASDLGFIDITLGTPMASVGAFANTFGTLQFDFFAPDNSLIASVPTSSGFVAWHDAGGIGRIRVTDTAQNQTSMIFDNLTFEDPVTPNTGAVPEPVSGVLLGVVMLAAGFGRRLRGKSA